MTGATKQKLKWGLICAIGAFILYNCLYVNPAVVAAEKKAKKYVKDTVNPVCTNMANHANKETSSDKRYDVDGLLQTLTEHKKRIEDCVRRAREHVEYVDTHNDEPQPQEVVDICVSRLTEAQKLNSEQDTEKADAQNTYDSSIAAWNQQAAQGDEGESTWLAEAREQEEKATTILNELLELINKAKGKGKAGSIYKKAKTRLENTLNQLRSRIAEHSENDTNTGKAEVIGLEGTVDENLPKLQQARHLLAEIQAVSHVDTNIEAPMLLPTEPEIPTEPDIILVATGDLGESLVEPLVVNWLKEEKKATSEHGFTWVLKDGHKHLTVNLPEGKLSIRLQTAKTKQEAFDSIAQSGQAHLLITGQKPDVGLEKIWLPTGKTLAQMDEALGRTYKARICYDALVFFRGSAFDEGSVRAEEVQGKSKVFSPDDPARCEATAAFGLSKKSGDVEVAGQPDRHTLCSNPMYSDKIVLGVWHKDCKIAGVDPRQAEQLAVAIRQDKAHTIRYASGWNCAEAMGTIPKKYRPYVKGVEPSEISISTGQYAYGYSIYGYRSARGKDSAGEALAGDLLQYVANVENPNIETLIRNCKFVPIKLDISNFPRDNRLRKDSLPLEVVFKKAPHLITDYGYTEEEQEWVYGVQVPMQLYYEVGSVESSLSLDADGNYYATTDKLAESIERCRKQHGAVTVVVLGHADPSWGGRLRVDKNSWEKNLELSDKRAEIVGKNKLGATSPAKPGVKYVSLGTSWARPARDITRDRDMIEQNKEFELCRRVEVFLIYPVPNSSASSIKKK